MTDKKEMLKKLQAQIHTKVEDRLDEKAQNLGVPKEVVKYVETLEERVEELEKRVKSLESAVN